MEEESINLFLASYLAQDTKADEVIIVDGGSTDSTTKIIEKFANKYLNLNIRLIVDNTCNLKHSIAPIAKGRNKGISIAKYENILVTDAGCKLDENWVKEISKPFMSDEVVAVAGWYEPTINNNFHKIFAEAMLPRLEKVNPKTFLPSSRSIAFKKKVWSKVGGYPEFTYTAEDTLFDINIIAKGYKFYFQPNAFVHWILPLNLREAHRKQYNYGYGDGQLRLNKFIIFKMVISVIIPIKIYLGKKSLKAKILKHYLSLINILGYVRGLLN